jgi:hypothetical protein
VVDGLPAQKTALVKAYVASTNGMLTLHFLLGYAPELNPDELVWSHMKRTGVARAPLRQGEKLQDKRDRYQDGCGGYSRGVGPQLGAPPACCASTLRRIERRFDL